MKLLLIGEKYSENLGDGVIFETVANICKRIYPDCIIENLDISGKSAYSASAEKATSNRKKASVVRRVARKLFGNPIFNLKRLRKVNACLKNIELSEIDYAIFVGGQLFMDYFVLPIFLVVKRLSKHSVPIVFNSCGVGKNNKRLNMFLLRKTINNENVKAISVRDNLDVFFEKYVKSENVKITKVLDPAFEVSKYFTMPDVKRKVVGIGIMSINVINKNGKNLEEAKLIDLLKMVISKIEKFGFEWELFTNGATYDYVYASRIAAKLSPDKKRLSPQPTRPMQLMGIISEYDKIISFRLHSHIIAASLGIASIGFVWDEKCAEFAKMTQNDYFVELNETILKNTETALDILLEDKLKVTIPKEIKSSEYIKSLDL